MPDTSRHFLPLQVSPSGLGAILVRSCSSTKALHPVSLFSAELKPHYRGYSTADLEAVVLVLALKWFYRHLCQHPHPVQIFVWPYSSCVSQLHATLQSMTSKVRLAGATVSSWPSSLPQGQDVSMVSLPWECTHTHAHNSAWDTACIFPFFFVCMAENLKGRRGGW